MRHRLATSAAYAAAYVLIAVAYAFFPPAQTSRPGVVSVARYIDTLGPIWVVAFGLAAVGLLVGVWAGRWLWLGHCVAAGVVAGYGVAALLSGVLSNAVYGSPMAFLCFATVVTHLLLAQRYQIGPGLVTGKGRHSVR